MSDYNLLVDEATEWLIEKGAVYLCKEDKIVWFSSITGSKLEEEWQSCTLEQAKRMIGYRASYTTIEIIIQALQELGVVYEMGVTSPFTTTQNIFNFSDNSPSSVMEKILTYLLKSLSRQKQAGMVSEDINRILEALQDILRISLSLREKNEVLARISPKLGFDHKHGTKKMNIFGTKKGGVLKKGFSTLYLRRFDNNEIAQLVSNIHRSLK